jgi:nucleotide-binding universal stress UspA family protein
LILALDGSVEAEKALRSITSRKWPDETEVRVMAVQDPVRPIRQSPPFAPFADPENFTSEEARAWIQTVVDTAADDLKACGLVVFPVVRTGDPRQLLLDECELFKADCMFLGARGLSRLDRFLLGSVSTAIAMRAQCSVEIVH